MKLIEIYESTDPHFSASPELDSTLNPESASYKKEEEKNSKKSKKTTDICVDDVDNGEDKWTTIPKKDEPQSSGYRGREESKYNAGIPNRPYQKHNPDYFHQESPIDIR